MNTEITLEDLQDICTGLLQDLHTARAEVNRLESAVQKLKESIDERL